MERICLESTNYARIKGDHNFTMNLDNYKAFTAIFLVTRYTEFPRQEKYWELEEEGHDFLVSSLMSQNELKERVKYLHLSDNNNLNMADRFAKVCSLFNSINSTSVLTSQWCHKLANMVLSNIFMRN